MIIILLLTSLYVNNLNMDETLNTIKELIRNGQKSYIIPINVDVVIKIENDPYLKQITEMRLCLNKSV